MGWEECNDDNYELTEAEIAEVINMIKEKQVSFQLRKYLIFKGKLGN
jgi:hypothetical protein